MLRCYNRIVLSGMGGVEVLQKNRTKWGAGGMSGVKKNHTKLGGGGRGYKRIILCFRWEELLISHSSQYGCPFLGLIEHMPIVCEVSSFLIVLSCFLF